ncbi:hypothetical protein TSUD_173340, partial [Trifolium subterraneum]
MYLFVRLLSSGTTIVPRAAAPVTDVQSGNQAETDTDPTPIVIIDQDSDPNAIVVEITFGDRLGALLDTESSAQLAMGAAFGLLPPKEQVDVDIATHIKISADGPDRSLFYVETADRPGLLVDLVKSITDIDIAVESGEFDTESQSQIATCNRNFNQSLECSIATSMAPVTTTTSIA